MANFYSPSLQFNDPNHRFFSTKRYTPLVFDGIPGLPNVIPDDIRKHLSKFNGNHTVSANQHVQVFSDLMGDYEIVHEDVHMRIICSNSRG